jgi:hypothetical protein
MKKLISGDLLEQWYQCQANFIYPLLVLLTDPVPFLVVILFFSALGIVVASRKRSQRANNVMLACYPFLFHCCFMVFYWCSSLSVLVITQFICLSLFFIGSVHQSITLVYETLSFFIKLARRCCKSNKIDPSPSKMKGMPSTQKMGLK